MENESFSKLKDRDGENGQASLDRKVCVPASSGMFACRPREKSTV